MEHNDCFEKLQFDFNNWEIATVGLFKKRLLFCFENLKTKLTDWDSLIKLCEIKNYCKIILEDFSDDDLVIDLGIEMKWQKQIKKQEKITME